MQLSTSNFRDRETTMDPKETPIEFLDLDSEGVISDSFSAFCSELCFSFFLDRALDYSFEKPNTFDSECCATCHPVACQPCEQWEEWSSRARRQGPLLGDLIDDDVDPKVEAHMTIGMFPMRQVTSRFDPGSKKRTMWHPTNALQANKKKRKA